MLTKSEQILLDALKQLAENGPPKEDRDFGICYNLDTYLEDVGGILRYKVGSHMKELFREWPEFSGNVEYPIGAKGRTPIGVYESTKDMWSKRSAYGKARWRLLHWMIDQLEKEQDHA